MNTLYTDAHPRITAVLGPTNTGKTHFAMARLLAHRTGMIGFPLRLLARENYDRAVKEKGAAQVALITGEEKIVPPGARYFMCTVESMPVDRLVEFLAIDEIQVAADPERGHIFTERLLSARGTHETVFLGAETMRGLMKALVPGVQIETRPRLSKLTYVGGAKVHRLKPRSAVVAFSASDVYALAELVRRHRGGAAVVLGALSPRTRNAQVAMYQSGEVDYLIATDAIGMGLNMDVRHVAFAQTRKFDGRVRRNLTSAEIAQIAGRAGRHKTDGTFGTTAEARAFDPEIVDRIEAHEFDALSHVYWRNPSLRFQTLDALAASLRESPDHPGLRRVREADDERALNALAQDTAIKVLATSPGRIQLLWRVCQIPDFRKLMDDGHTALLKRLYLMLMGADPETPGTGTGKLNPDWVAGQVARIDRMDGDIHTLSARIAAIRTWTYIAHHADWLEDALAWCERTRDVEDRLSDALHDRLRLSFVDKRTAALVSGLRDQRDLLAAVRRDGVVIVEGHPVGTLEGLKFIPVEAEAGVARRAVRSAADRVLGETLSARSHQIANAPESDISIDDYLNLIWEEFPIGRLTKGRDLMRPDVRVLAESIIAPDDRDRVEVRLQAWVDQSLGTILKPLFAQTSAYSSSVRGIHYQVSEGLGNAPRVQVAPLIAALTREDRKALRQMAITLGREHVFIPKLLKPEARRWRALLWAVWTEQRGIGFLPNDGQASFSIDALMDRDRLHHLGFALCRTRAVRLDMVERIADLAWEASKKGPFQPSAAMVTALGTNAEETRLVLGQLGYRAAKPPPNTESSDPWLRRATKPARREIEAAEIQKKGQSKAKVRQMSADSPFAALAALVKDG